MGEPRTSLKRFFVEGVVIVVSILSAFAIDAWWDGRQEAEDYDRMVASMLSETAANREIVERLIADHDSFNARIDTLFEAIDGESVPVDRLEAGLLAIAAYYPVEFRTTSYEAALANPLWGELPIEARDALAAVLSRADRAFSDEVYAAHALNRLNDAMDRYGSVRAFWPEVEGPVPPDWDGLLNDPVLESAAAVMRILYTNTRERLEEWSDDFEELERALERARVEGPAG